MTSFKQVYLERARKRGYAFTQFSDQPRIKPWMWTLLSIVLATISATIVIVALVFFLKLLDLML